MPKHYFAKHNWSKIREYYITDEEFPSLRACGIKFGVNHRQVGRKSAKEDWPRQRKEYWEAIASEDRQNAQQRQIQRNQENRRFIRFVKKYLYDLIKAKKLKGCVGDVDKIIRLEELLSGNPDVRIESNNNYEEIINLIECKRKQVDKQEIKFSYDRLPEQPNIQNGKES